MTDYTVTNSWQAMSVLTGEPSGTELQVQNKGNSAIVLNESTTIPDENSTSGEVISTFYTGGGETTKVILSGSLEVWIKAVQGHSLVSVQKL